MKSSFFFVTLIFRKTGVFFSLYWILVYKARYFFLRLLIVKHCFFFDRKIHCFFLGLMIEKLTVSSLDWLQQWCVSECWWRRLPWSLAAETLGQGYIFDLKNFSVFIFVWLSGFQWQISFSNRLEFRSGPDEWKIRFFFFLGQHQRKCFDFV